MHCFDATLVSGRKRPYATWTFLIIPSKLAKTWGPGQKMIRGTMSGKVFRGTASRGDGVLRMPVPRALQKAAGVRCGDAVAVALELDTEPRSVTLPKELQAVFDIDRDVAALYERLPPSHRRAWATYVAEAKRPETRSRRAKAAPKGIRARAFPSQVDGVVRGDPAAASTRTRTRASGAITSKRKPVLLAGGNPQIAMAAGDAPVQAYLAAMPGWKRDVGRRLDALITRTVPDVRKAVKWNSPFYGIAGRGWFLGLHTFTNSVKVTFFRGTLLRPVPAGGTGKDARWINVHEANLDEQQLSAWIAQAAKLPGWATSDIREG